MIASRCAARAPIRLSRLSPTSTRHLSTSPKSRSNTRVRVYSPYAARRQQHFIRSVTTVIALGAFGTGLQWYSTNANGRLFRDVYAEVPDLTDPEPKFEKARKRAKNKEENRDIISSQHLQVKKSWENPGVYAWGSNAGKVVAPDSDEAFVKTPRRIQWFDGMLLRDIKLDRSFGAAIDERGDLLQWGTSYSADASRPVTTLKGKNLTSITISRDRILGLSSSGKVYSVPVSQEDQITGPKAADDAWLPLWVSTPNISYKQLKPHNMSWGERITSISAGQEHVLLLTSRGRLFSAAAGTHDYPGKGQLGIPGLSWATRPAGDYHQCHEITTLKGFDIKKIAAGDYHSLAVDREGRCFSFGDNSLGQLGFPYNDESNLVDSPSLLPITRLYSGTSMIPTVTSVAAGGSNSYFTIDATRTVAPGEDPSDPRVNRGLGRVQADTWSCGHGIWGTLGNGKWTHVQNMPTKIPSLSGLYEYDENTNKTVPIRLARLSVGQTHAAAVMSNITYLAASPTGSANDTNWGADIVFFGNNEYYQLGTGKRNNCSTPTYIQPLDQQAERKVRGKEEHRFQITPARRVKLGDGRWKNVEQRVECGRGVTGVYSAVVQ